MNPNRLPVHQALIRKLPFKRNAAARVLGLLFGPRVTARVNEFSMNLDLRETIQRLMFLDMYEPEQTAWFRQCLRSGDTVIDVGASFGYYTTLASTLVGPSGRVFAFEPSPHASKVIEQAIVEAANTNITLTKAAVGSRAGSAVLFLPTTRNLHSPSMLRSDAQFSPLEIPVVALDKFEPLKDVPRIKLVKIDVEGYEPDVLDGMETLIRAGRVENIICELNSGWLKRNSTTPSELFKRFIGLGYEVRRQTRLQENLRGHRGELFNLQDVWFSAGSG